MDAHGSIKKLFQLYVGKRFSKVGWEAFFQSRESPVWKMVACGTRSGD